MTLTARCVLSNSFTKCLTEKRLTIVVIGNSVSYGAAFEGDKIDSYYVHLADWFRETFPLADIDVKLGIIFAIGPEVQLFRMEDKALKPQPDLVVTEFGAANGVWGERGRAITERATEGYVRRLLALRPEADVLMNLGLQERMMEAYREGRTPASVLFQERVARHYDCALTDPGTAIAQKVLAGEPWERFMNDGIHPGPQGYAVHGQTIREELDRQYSRYQELDADARAAKPHPLPAAALLPDPWVLPRLVPAGAAELQGFRSGASGRVSYVEATSPAASGSFEAANGRIVGLLYQFQPDPEDRPQPELEVRLDGAEEWTRLPRNEPVFPEEDDRAHLSSGSFSGPTICRSIAAVSISVWSLRAGRRKTRSTYAS